jgi:hypothetical protein
MLENVPFFLHTIIIVEKPAHSGSEPSLGDNHRFCCVKEENPHPKEHACIGNSPGFLPDVL